MREHYSFYIFKALCYFYTLYKIKTKNALVTIFTTFLFFLIISNIQYTNSAEHCFRLYAIT